MASNHQRNRISNAVDSLIAHLVPGSADDDEQRAQERHDACVDIVRTILDR
jgi:gamma-tubulin complex component 3